MKNEVKLRNRKYLLSIKVINFLTKSNEFVHKIRAIRKHSHALCCKCKQMTAIK